MQPPYTIHYILPTTTATRTIKCHCTVCHQPTLAILDYTSYSRWKDGELIQDCFPLMRPEDREALISGTHPHCFDSLFAAKRPPNSKTSP